MMYLNGYLDNMLTMRTNINVTGVLLCWPRPLLAGYMESAAGTSGASAEKDKGKKSGRAARGKEDKDQMKFQF